LKHCAFFAVGSGPYVFFRQTPGFANYAFYPFRKTKFIGNFLPSLKPLVFMILFQENGGPNLKISWQNKLLPPPPPLPPQKRLLNSHVRFASVLLLLIFAFFFVFQIIYLNASDFSALKSHVENLKVGNVS